MKAEGSVKHEHIVEAAIRRFSHYGINKTTMAEIADDTGIAKPSLFYYFPDKGSLLEAVGRKIIDEFLQAFEAVIHSAKSVDEGLLQFIEIKRQHFKKYLLLALQADNAEMNKVSSQLPEIVSEAHKKVELLISALLTRGIQQKALRTLDVEKVSLLVMEILEAFEHCIKSKTVLLESKNIDALFDKQKEVVEVLLNGLKKQPLEELVEAK